MPAEATLEVLISAKDEASDKIKNVGDAADSLSERFDAAAKSSGILLAGLTALAGVVGYTSLNAFMKEEVALMKMNAMMNTVLGTTDATKKVMMDASMVTMKLGFEHERTGESIAYFYQRTKDATEAIKLNNLAMDLSRARNIDLETATRMVGLVLSGSARALKLYGIELKDSATPLEALAELQLMVANQSTTFASTTAGSVAILTVAFGELQESIGAIIAQALTPLLRGMIEWMDRMGGAEGVFAVFKQWIEDNRLSVGLLAGAIVGALIPALVAGAIAIWNFVAPLLPFIAIGMAIAGIIALLTDNFSNMNAILIPLQNVWNVIINSFREGSVLGDTLRGVWQGIVDVWNTSFKPALLELWTALQPLMPYLKELAIVFGMILLGAIVLFVGVALAALTAVVNIVTWLIQVFNDFMNVVTDVMAFFILLFSGQWVAAWEMFKTTVTDSVNFVINFFAGFVKIIAGFIDSIYQFFVGLFTKLIGGSLIPDLVNGIVGWFAKLPELVGTILTGWVNSVIATFVGLKDSIVSTISSAVSQVSSMFSGMVSAAQSAVASASQAVSGAYGAVRGAVGAGIGAVKAVFKQEGGIVRKPTLVVAGEAGAEAIVPLKKGGGFLGNITITGNYIMASSPDEVAELIGDALINKLNLQMRIG